MPQYQKKRLPGRRGEDYLQTVESFAIRLENGETVQVRMADELAVSDDPRIQYRESLKAPARLAFWTYQTERALSRLKKKETAFAAAEGEDYLTYRTFIQEHTSVEMATEGNIRARMARAPSIETKTAKAEMEDARESYGVLRALQVACEHRSHLLRRLIAHEHEAG